jgi:hypothetical protein
MKKVFLAIFATIAASAAPVVAQTPEPTLAPPVSLWFPVDTLQPGDNEYGIMDYDSLYDRFALPGFPGGRKDIKKFAYSVEVFGIPLSINTGWAPAETGKIAEFFNLFFNEAAYRQAYRDTMPSTIDSAWLDVQREFWVQRLVGRGFVTPPRTIFVIFFGENSQCLALRLSANPSVEPLYKFFPWPVNMTLADIRTNRSISQKAYDALVATGATDLVGLWKLGRAATPEKFQKTVAGLLARYKFDVNDWNIR